MHYNPNVVEAFNSVEHIMRDVNNGWLIRYLHANTASAFFFLVYLHIGKGLYYGSYKAPRTLTWTIGTIIFILMMAKNKWPNWMLINRNKCNQYYLSFAKSRTKALHRIGPHNKDVLTIIICGMLGDWWADKIKGQITPSVRFNIEQGISNTAYIHSLTLYLNKLGYCSNITPSLVRKQYNLNKIEDTFNYRLSLYTFTSLLWIYDSFYKDVDGIKIKVVPFWIAEYLTPLGLAHWIMQDGSRQLNQGIYIATHSFTFEECTYLCSILKNKYNLKCTVIKTGFANQWRISIWKESMSKLVSIVKPYIIDEMKYKFMGYI